jgi:hypothetical protein
LIVSLKSNKRIKDKNILIKVIFAFIGRGYFRIIMKKITKNEELKILSNCDKLAW